MRAILGSAVFCVAAVFCAATALGQDQDEWEALVDLDAAFQQGVAQSDFTFKNVKRARFMADLPDAMDTHFNDHKILGKEGVVSYNGRMNLARIRFTPVEIAFDGNSVYDAPFDLIRGENCVIYYSPQYRFDDKRVKRDRLSFQFASYAFEGLAAYPHVIQFSLLDFKSVLLYLQPGYKEGQKFNFRMLPSDANKVCIESADEQLPVVRRLTFLTESRFPMIIEKEEIVTLPDGSSTRLVQSAVELVDSVDGRRLPRRIHSYYGPMQDQALPYFVQQWEGDLAGKAGADAFVLNVGNNVSIDVDERLPVQEMRKSIKENGGKLDGTEIIKMLSSHKESSTPESTNPSAIAPMENISEETPKETEWSIGGKSPLAPAFVWSLIAFGCLVAFSLVIAIRYRLKRGEPEFGD